MKKTISVLSLILVLAACNEPKMRLRAPQPKEAKKTPALEKKDTVKTVRP